MNAFAEPNDLTGQLHARRERHLGLVLVLASRLHQVRKIDGAGQDPDQHFARLRVWCGDILDHTPGIFGRQLFDHQGTHQVVRSLRESRTNSAICRHAASAAGMAPVKAVKPWAKLS